MSGAVAIAVVSWNTRELLRACLRSMRPEVEAGGATVWVVDNDSEDGSPEMVESAFGWANLLVPGENLGFGRAVNLVAERSQSQWIAPANADIELTPGALDRLVAAGEEDPECGIVAPRLVLPDGATQHSVHAFPTVSLAAFVGLGLPRVSARLGQRLCIEGRWDPDLARRVDWAHGAFLLVRRRAFDAVGGFDRDQWMYAEDLDLAWRLWRARWTTRYEPSAVVHHVVGAATGVAFAGERSARYMTATYSWMARRRGVLVAWAHAAVGFLGAGARWLALAPLAAVAPQRWSAARASARHWMDLHRLGFRRRASLLAHR